MRILAFLSLSLSLAAAHADPLNDSMELGASVSHSYDARNVFVNPAALGFQAALNGNGPLTSFAYGMNRGHRDEMSGSIALGYFGFGLESLSNPAGKYLRYHFGAGFPLADELYLGARYLLHRPQNAPQNNFSGIDLGMQWRPSSLFSLGLMANRLNQPDVGGVKAPVQFVLGGILRPLPWLELAADIDTESRNFGKTFGYQATVGVEPITGIRFRAGYHKDYKAQVGLQWSFGNVAAFSTFQPSSDSKRLVTGIMVSPLPYRSPIRKIAGLKLEVDSSLSAEGTKRGLLAGGEPSLLDLLSELQRAGEQGIKLLVLKVESFPLGLASAEDVFDELSRLREKGTHIEVFLGNAGLKEYLIASAAHAIHIERSGSIAMLGFKSEGYFAKGLLDKLGVEGEFLARGEYKSAPEMFTRRESSPINRQAILDELKEAEDQLLPLLGRHRKMTPARWQKLVSHAVFSSSDALSAGLIDAVGTYDNAVDQFGNGYVMRDSLSEQSDRLNLAKRVAVIHVNGDILQHKNSALSLGGRAAATPERLERHFKRAEKDLRTKAIVVRINSGGGEILASEQIASLVEKAKRKIPVIISMGDAAASGGYMISAPGDRIFAQPLTITGSIGVFLGKFSLAGTYKWLQLNKEILSHAPYPGLFSEHKPWSPAEREILLRRMNQFYDEFVGYVAHHRKIPVAVADAGAKGRVWLGTSALRHKLIDELGGYREAIDHAATKAGLAQGEYEAWAIQDSPPLFGLLGSSPFLAKSGVESLVPPTLAREIFWMSQLQQSPFLYLSEIDSL